MGAEIAANGRLPWQRVADIGDQVADALAVAHAARVVHRDLKPDNVLLSGRRAIVTDFGIARILDATGNLTGDKVIGTPRYMAPELWEGGGADPPSDMWALGATLYNAVEGIPPFEANTHAAIMAAILTRNPPPAKHAGPLADLLVALLAKDPAQRPDARYATQALASLRSGPTTNNRAGVSSAAPDSPSSLTGSGPVTVPAADAPVHHAPVLTTPPLPTSENKPDRSDVATKGHLITPPLPSAMAAERPPVTRAAPGTVKSPAASRRKILAIAAAVLGVALAASLIPYALLAGHQSAKRFSSGELIEAYSFWT